MNTLHQTGRVSLQGTSAVWSTTTRVLFIVLIALIGFVVVGGTIAVVVLGVSGPGVSPGAIIGFFTSFVMMGGVAALVTYGFRKQNRYRATESEPVILEPNGLTMRGVGPIPWMDFGPAEHRMIPAERTDGYARRAVMELTPAGLYNVNERTPPETRQKISPAMGPFWNRHHRYIYVPGVEGLKQREVMELINTAARIHGGTRIQFPHQ